jgi:hypothetical protein
MPSIDFTIIVGDESNVSIKYTDSRGPRERKGKLIPDPIAQFTVRRMNEWINFGLLINQTGGRDALNPDDLKAIGLNLYRILLSDPEVEMRFRDLYDDLSSDRASERVSADCRMRLKLVFQEAAARLGELPWELLFIPDQSIGETGPDKILPSGFFFGEREDLILTRYSPPAGAEQHFEIGDQPLKVLLAIYTGFPGMNVIRTEEIQIVKKQMENIPGATILTDARNLSFRKLKDRLSKEKPHIVHFIGHGDAGQITLALGEGDEGFKGGSEPEVCWLKADAFRRLFDYVGKPRLVFLQACNGSASPTNSLSCAQELIQYGIPAVIAMQHSIRAIDAVNFAAVFYQNLAKGADIDESVRAGRHELGDPSYNHPRFGTPVVCLRTEDRLVNLKSIAKQEESRREETVAAPSAPTTAVAAPAAITTAPVTAPVAERPIEPSSQFQRIA